MLSVCFMMVFMTCSVSCYSETHSLSSVFMSAARWRNGCWSYLVIVYVTCSAIISDVLEAHPFHMLLQHAPGFADHVVIVFAGVVYGVGVGQYSFVQLELLSFGKLG